MAEVEAQVEAAHKAAHKAITRVAQQNAILAKYDKALPAAVHAQAAGSGPSHAHADKEAVEIQKLKDELAAKDLKSKLAQAEAELKNKEL